MTRPNHGLFLLSLRLGAAILLLMLAASFLPGEAGAHGALTTPGSRTWLCRVDGTHETGDIIPNNAACADAIAQGGKQPLWDWFGVLRPDGAGRTRGYIPDGSLCSGGNDTYAGYDQARADWPYTRLTAGADVRLAYNAWAPHPGEFRLYVTKEGFDPNKPLTWDDLDEQPFTTYTAANPNATDQLNQTPEYTWTAALPARSGAHIIYSIWQRSDSDETFYGCSDVMFDGGSGEVVGVGPAGAQTLAGLAPAAPGAEQPSSTTVPGQPADGATTTPPENSDAMTEETAEGMVDGEAEGGTASVPGIPATGQPVADGSTSAPGLATTQAITTTSIGLKVALAIGLGGLALGVVGSVAAWALVELRRAHRKLARLEASTWTDAGQDEHLVPGDPFDRFQPTYPLDRAAPSTSATTTTAGTGAETTGELELQRLGR